MDIFWASLSGIFEWVLRTSMYGAVIVLVIVAVQAIGRKKLPPRWSYTLWGVLLLRLVLPVGLQSGFSVWNLAPRGDEKVVSVSAEDDAGAAAPILNATEDVSPSGEFDSSDLPSTNGALAGEGEYVIPAADISSERTVAFNWKDAWRYAPGIWLAGAVLLAVSIAFSNLRLWLSVRKERLLTDQGLLELFEDCKQQMQVRTVVGLVATDRVKSPSLFGFIRPRVLLPREVIEHTRAEELRYIFLHELAHLKRGDIWVGWVVAALQSLHWFNPLIWWAFARMRTDRELACDALALSQVRSEENRLYGGALVSLLERFSQSQPLPAVAGILENKAQLKRRLTMISQFKRPTRRAGFVAAILLAVLAGALLTDAKDNVASSTNDVAATVRHAVTSIATMQESDPQIPDLLASVKALNGQEAATELAGYLDHERATMRRAAVFILWQGDLDTIEPALPALRNLLNHPEAETRGMAALALGSAKDAGSFDKLCDLTKNDASAYTRRCTAYALGLLGDQRAVSVLKEAVKDADFNVRNNADAALVMLQEQPAISTPSSPVAPDDGAPKIVSTIPAVFDNKVSADLKEIAVTFDRKMRNGSWSWTGGGETYPETTGRPSYNDDCTTCRLPVRLAPGNVYWVGINSPSHRNFKSADDVPVNRYVICFATAGADGSPTPIPPEIRTRAAQINGSVRPRRTSRAITNAPAPGIVNTTPLSLANDVSSQLNKITVTFDQSMQDGSWSWTGGGDTYPKTTSRPHYDRDRTTCNLPVQLEPGKVYWVGINSPSHKNFKSAQGVPASWYIILFATAGADGSPTPIPNDMLDRARQINRRTEIEMARRDRNATDDQDVNMTQIMHNDIQADGTIHFINTVRYPYEGSEPLKQTTLVFSDFFKVEKIYDVQKRPLEYTAMREENSVSYAIQFKEPIQPGGIMEYTSEGVEEGMITPYLGDAKAFRYMMTHWPGTNYPVRRVETFILPAGARVQGQIMPSEMRQTAKDGRIELHVEKIIPADGSLTVAFQYTMADAKAPFEVETTTDASGRRVDKINYPYRTDREVIGQWETVDFIENIDNFKPGQKQWRDELFLKGIHFLNGGRTDGPWTWTKGLVIHPGDKMASTYEIKTINDEKYMFLQCKTGDYVLHGMKPWYNVLKKK